MRPVTGRRLRWIRPPRQARSRDKLARMLDAAEALLEEQSFEQLGVAEVTARASAAVGTFYSRFADKEALLTALYERHLSELHATTSAMLDPKRWQGTPLAEVLRAIVAFTVSYHRRHRGLLRALVLRSHARPDGRYASRSERSRSTVARVARLVAARAEEVGHPMPRQAAALGFLSLLGAVRERILFRDSVGRVVAVSDRRLAEELTRQFMAYLEVRHPDGRRRTSGKEGSSRAGRESS